MISSTLKTFKITLLVMAILFNKWSAIYRKYIQIWSVCAVETEEDRKCHREQGLRQWKPIDCLRFPKANLARLNKFVFFPNRYESNSKSTLFPH